MTTTSTSSSSFDDVVNNNNSISSSNEEDEDVATTTEVLDVLFLLFETTQEQVHNRNQLACTQYLQDGFVNISNKTSSEVQVIMIHFFETDPLNHKMVIYVGFGENYCDLQCGGDTQISEHQFSQILQSNCGAKQLYLSWLCTTRDYYGEDSTNDISFLLDMHVTFRHRVRVLWDRTKQRFLTNLLNRRDIIGYDVIEKVIANYKSVRMYEE